MKNIEWLKENVQKRIDKLPRTYSGLYIDGSRDAYHLALKDINQLDEPEVLSQELPAIPKFVVEFLIGKEDYMLYELFDDEWLYKEHDRVAKWLYDNDELTNKQREIDLVVARDRGFTVEERELTIKGVIEEHIELLKKQEVAVNLKPYYDLWEELKDD